MTAQGAGARSIRIVVRRGLHTVADIKTVEQSLTLGRGKDASVVLDDPAVSRSHAMLVRDQGQIVLIDQRSQNGIWLVGTRVPRVVMEPGVAVTIGPFVVSAEAYEQAADDPIAPADLIDHDATIAFPMAVPVEPSGPAPPTASVGAVTLPLSAAASSATPESKTAPTQRATPAAVWKDPGPGAAARIVPFPGAASVRRGWAGALTGAALALMILGAGIWWVSRSRTETGVTSTPPTAVAPSVDTRPSQPVAPPTGQVPAEPDTQPAPAAETASAAESNATPTVSTVPDAADARSVATVIRRERAAASDPGVIPAGKRPNESVAAWRLRSRELTDQYNRGRAAINREDYVQAIAIFTDLQKKEPGYADATAMIEKARATIRSRAQAAFDEAYRLDTQGDLKGALDGYLESQRLDPDFERAVEAIQSIRERTKTYATELMRRATAEDAFGRVAPAATLYKRVLELLPESDPNYVKAQQRLNALQGAKP